MAFTASDDENPNDPNSEQAQQQAQQQRDTFSNPTTGGGSALFGNAPGGGGPANANPAPKSNSSGTGWTGIDKYLAANSDQAAGMGQALASSVGGQAQGAQDAVNNLSQDFGNQVNANTVNFNGDSVNKDISDATNLKAGSAYDPNDITDFQKYAGANYSGPNDLTTDSQYGSANSAVSKAQGALNSAQTESGRQDLLNQTYGGNGLGYNNGEKALDSGLVEASPDAQKAISGVENQWSGLSGLLGQARQNASTQAQQAAATDQATRQQAAEALGSYGTDASGTGGKGALGDWSKGIFGQSDAASKAYQNAQSQLNTAAGSGQLTPDQMKSIGLDPAMRNYGVAFGPNYLQGGTADTVANVASNDQYAQQAALAQLAGLTAGGAGAAGTPVLNQANIAQAGTGAGINGNAMATVSPTFQSDVNAAKAGLPNQIAQVLDSYAAAKGINLDGFQVENFDPNTMLATVQGGSGGGNTNSFNVSLNPDSEYSASNPNTFTGQQMSNVYNGLGSYTPWQQLVQMAGGTLGGGSGWVTPGLNPSGVAPHNSGHGVRGGPVMPSQALAHGGQVMPANPMASVNKVLSEKVAAPVKEPKIPKIPRPDTKLPTMPKFAEGGDVLDANARAHIASKNFAEPGKHKYPIHDIEHARNALAKVAQFGSPAEQAVVRRQVHAHYPSLAKAAGGEVPTTPSAYTGEALKAGGTVPGAPKVDHNSYSNDTVEARLSPKEVVLPLSVTQSRDPVKAAADFMASVLLKKDKK